jgi:hypothetical protein
MNFMYGDFPNIDKEKLAIGDIFSQIVRTSPFI